MPPHLRLLYEDGSWKNDHVYLWPRVLALSKEGHARAAIAERSLEHLKYKPHAPIPIHPSLANAAVKDARAVVDRVRDDVRVVLKKRKQEKEKRRRELAKEYMARRKKWMRQLEEQRNSATEEEKRASKQRDRELLLATRTPVAGTGAMSLREVNLVFQEIESAGGTSGGLERWGRSITWIPDHNPHQLPPACDGGVLIENPLAAHYAARNINPWTRAEKQLFLEKFLIHGKNFRKISTFFEHKTVDDVVRFYFDNKKQFKLKQLAKDNNVRRKGITKKTFLQELAMMPRESRSIKDNFIHQEDMQSESDTEAEKESLKAEKLSQRALGRGWSGEDRKKLIFALCRFDVTEDEESKPVPNVWTNIASVIGSKTPRQCRQFYFTYKTVLGLDGFLPPKTEQVSSPESSSCSPSSWAPAKFEYVRRHVMARTTSNGNGRSDILL